MIFVNKF